MNLKDLTLLCLIGILFSCSSEEDDINTTEIISCFSAPEQIEAGLPATFNSECSKNAVSYAWTFGTAGTSEEANPAFTFSRAGTYTVSLKVTDASGNADSTSQSVDVVKSSVEPITHMGDINEDQVWEAGIHKIFGFVFVNNATLTIMPGAIIKFREGSYLKVGTQDGVTEAALIAEGTATQPIIFTADSDEPTPGFWDYISFGSGEAGISSMKHCTIEYGGDSYGGMVSVYGGASVAIENCTVQHSSGIGVSLSDTGFRTFENNTITDCGTYLMEVDPNVLESIGHNNQFDSDNRIRIENMRLEVAATTWKKLSCPYFIGGEHFIGSEFGTELTIEPGTSIFFSKYSKMVFGSTDGSLKGKLIAEGTEASPITFTANVPEDRWYGLTFNAGSEGSSIEHAVFEHTNGGNTEVQYAIGVNTTNIAVNNTTIRDANKYAIVCDEEGYFSSFENNTIENGDQNGILMYANWVQTLGNTSTIEADKEVMIKKDIMEHDAITWKKQPFPYTIDGYINIGNDGNGVVWTIEAGTTIEIFSPYHFIVPTGSGGLGIIANGTAAEPIIFTSGDDIPEGGDWGAIQLYNDTKEGTIFNHCIFEYGGVYGAPLELSYTDAPVITNCTFRNNEEYGLGLQGSNPTMENNTFENNPMGDILRTQ